MEVLMSANGNMKTRPINEIVTELLNSDDNLQGVAVWARVYKEGITMPQDGIEPLVEAFMKAKRNYRLIINEAIIAIKWPKKDQATKKI